MQPNQSDDYWQQTGTDEGGSQPVSNSEAGGQATNKETPDPIRWRASEYVHHDKQALWFVGLAAAAVVLILVAIFLVHSYSFAVLIAVMSAAVGYMGGRPPREVDYEIAQTGVKVGEKHFDYQQFASFGVVQDGPLYSVVLMPTKRFMPAVNMYFPEEMGETIVDTLGTVLPMQEVHLDVMDKLSRKLRF